MIAGMIVITAVSTFLAYREGYQRGLVSAYKHSKQLMEEP